MLHSILVLLLAAWLLFAFIGEALNPFASSGVARKRSRWRRGRRVAASLLLAGGVGLGLFWSETLSLVPSAAVAGLIFLPLALFFSRKHIRRMIIGEEPAVHEEFIADDRDVRTRSNALASAPPDRKNARSASDVEIAPRRRDRDGKAHDHVHE